MHIMHTHNWQTFETHNWYTSSTFTLLCKAPSPLMFIHVDAWSFIKSAPVLLSLEQRKYLTKDVKLHFEQRRAKVDGMTLTNVCKSCFTCRQMHRLLLNHLTIESKQRFENSSGKQTRHHTTQHPNASAYSGEPKTSYCLNSCLNGMLFIHLILCRLLTCNGKVIKTH